jgi:hypothetical protein
MSLPEDQPTAEEEKSTVDEEAPEVVAHSDEEEQPITGDCEGFKGGCISW